MPTTVTSIPLVDPHAPKADPSIGDLVKDATEQVSTLVRAEVALAKAEMTREVKKGLTGSVFFIGALVVLFYSTSFFSSSSPNCWTPGCSAGWPSSSCSADGRGHRGAGVARLSQGATDARAGADHRIGQGAARRCRPGFGTARSIDAAPRQARLSPNAPRLVISPPDPSVVRIDGPWRHLEVHANGIRFHVVEAKTAGRESRTTPDERRW